MNKRTKQSIFFAIIILTIGFVFLNVLAYIHVHSMMEFTNSGEPTAKPESLSFFDKMKALLTGINIPRPYGNRCPSDVGMEYRSVNIPVEQNILLGAWYIGDDISKPLIILFHGYADDKSSLLREAAAFRDMGLSVLLVDFRGSGESSESYSTIGYHEAEDVAATVRYAQNNFQYSSLVLFGRSMGAAAVLRAVDKFGTIPDAIIAESVFDRMVSAVRNRFRVMGVPSFPNTELLMFWGGIRKRFDGFDHNPVEYARNVTCPILFLHGTDDQRTLLREARHVYNSVHGQKFFGEFQGAGHEAFLKSFPVEWKGIVSEFLMSVGGIVSR
jgi:pimeloyl-ACP methyl ester carboxylesterase